MYKSWVIASAVLLFLVFQLSSCRGTPAKPKLVAPSGPISLVTLSEPGDSVITSVGSITVSPNGARMLLVDPQVGRAFLYLKNGVLEHCYSIPASFSDSLVLALPKYADTLALMRADHVQSPNGDSMPPDVQSKYLRNRVQSGIFLNDSEILLAGPIIAFTRNINDSVFCTPSTVLAKCTSLVKINLISNEIRVTPLKMERVFHWIFPEGNDITFSSRRQQTLVNEVYWSAFQRNLLDSTWVVGSYRADGSKNVDLVHLPPECSNSVIDYGNQHPRMCIDSSDNLIVAFEKLPMVFNVNRGTSFPLANLPFSNDTFLQAGRDAFARHQNPVRMDSIGALNRIWLEGLGITRNNGSFVCTSNKIQWSPWRFILIIQEYSTNGKVIRQMNLPSEMREGRPLLACYDASANGVVVVLKSQDRWKCATYSWDN